MLANNINLGRRINDIEFLSECSDPAFFIDNVLGYKPSGFHREMVQEAMKNRFLLIEVPRGHAKTTMISKGYATWLLWKERGVEICLTSSSMKQSKKFLAEIKQMITENPFLKHLVPSDRDLSWNKEEMKTTNGNYLYVKPFNDSARGMQPHYIIYDDILRIEDSNTTAEDKEEIFWSVFFPAGQTNRCKHFVVGTPAFEGDLFDKIEKNSIEDGDWKHIHYACVEVDSAGNWVKPLWPERYTLEELKKIQSMMSPILFAREYMCFSGDTEIHTPNGVKEIQKVSVGDFVLSGSFKQRKVLSIFERNVEKYYELKLNKYNKPIKTTEDHPWYVIKDGKIIIKKTKDLTNFDEIIMPYKKGIEKNDSDLATIYGWYLAEGSIGAKDRSVVFYMATKEKENIKKLIKSLKNKGYSPKKYNYRDKSVTPITINSHLLVKELLHYFGRAKNKHIDFKIHDFDVNFKINLLESYLNGDGCKTKNGYECSSVSKNLSEGIARIAESIGYVVSREYDLKQGKGGLVDGREIKGNGYFHRLRIYLNSRTTKIQNGFIINKIKSIKKILSPLNVFNIEVDNENNYIVGNALVHNCDPASAGGDVYDKDNLARAMDHNLDFSFETQKGMTVIGHDVAFSKSVKADWTVLIVLTICEEPHKIIQYIGKEKQERLIENPIIINRIIRRKSVDIEETERIYNITKSSRIIIDKSTGGVLVGSDLRAKGMNVDEQDFGPTNRQHMLLNLAKIIDSGRLVIPFKSPSTKMMVDILLKELRGMQIGQTKLGNQNIVSTTSHDDMVMALALAMKPINSSVKSETKLIISSDIDFKPKTFIEFKKDDKTTNNSFFERKTVKIPGLSDNV